MGICILQHRPCRCPSTRQPGQPGAELWVQLELKVIADVGLVGFPNVGKSTLLSVVSNAKPEIANYHFTTLNPHLGVVDLGDGAGFVMADIPGLIEGASEGIGLGHAFLKHIERTKVLVHVVDGASVEGRDPLEDIRTINRELEAYNPELLKRPQVIAANKMDAVYAEEDTEIILDELRNEFEPKGIRVFPISAVSRQGVKELLYHINDLLKQWMMRLLCLRRNSRSSTRATETCLIRLPGQMTELMWWKVPESTRCLDTPIWILRRDLISSRSSLRIREFWTTWRRPA
mgnify:CR=1 FL=1